MKKVLAGFLGLMFAGLVYCQVPVTKSKSDTTKTTSTTTTVLKKKLVKVSAIKINVAHASPAKENNINPDNNGTKEEDQVPK